MSAWSGYGYVIREDETGRFFTGRKRDGEWNPVLGKAWTFGTREGADLMAEELGEVSVLKVIFRLENLTCELVEEKPPKAQSVRVRVEVDEKALQGKSEFMEALEKFQGAMNVASAKRGAMAEAAKQKTIIAEEEVKPRPLPALSPYTDHLAVTQRRVDPDRYEISIATTIVAFDRGACITHFRQLVEGLIGPGPRSK